MKRWTNFMTALAAALSTETFAQVPHLESPKSIADFASKQCTECHNKETQRGGFDFETLLKEKDVSVSPAMWSSVLERVVSRDMPPKKRATRPTEQQYQAMEKWLREQLLTHEAIAAMKRPQPARRLNRVEYNRSVQEVFGVSVSPADHFPPDDAVHGFTNIAEGLNLSTVLVEQYFNAAHTVASHALTAGAQPESRKQLFTWGYYDTKRGDGPIRPQHPNAHIQKKEKDKAWWVGSFFGIEWNAKARGTYRVRLSAMPRFSAKPELVPHILHRMNERIVVEADVPVRDGVRMQQEFFVEVHDAGNVSMNYEWVNGFHLDKNHETFLAKSEWEKRAEKNPNEPYPFPYFEDMEYEVEGPLFPQGWPPTRFQRENADAIAAKDAKKVAEWLLPRLYRRPAKLEEIADFAKRVEAAGKANFIESLRVGVMSSLMSPEFLFMVEPGPRGRTLTDYELATRLSYFLWSAPPDDELRGLAARNALRPALAAQTKRMLADRRSDAFLDRFTTEWLGLAKLSSQMPEPKLFPNFDEALRSAMAAEPRAFMGNLLRENRSIFDLLDSPYVFVNDRLAKHYGLPDVQGGDLRKVSLTPGQQAKRGGLLTQAAFLTITSEQTRTSPVIRGKWILDTLFNRPPPPPPPNVAALTPDVSKAKGIVEHLRIHRTEPNCAGCHERIDPFGIALENFNAIGAWRDTEPIWEDPARPTKRNPNAKAPEYPIDTAFKLGGFDGSGVAGLKAYLQANRTRFARGFTEKLAMYALGRSVLLSDEAALSSIVATAEKDDGRIQSLVIAIVQSPIFQNR